MINKDYYSSYQKKKDNSFIIYERPTVSSDIISSIILVLCIISVGIVL